MKKSLGARLAPLVCPVWVVGTYSKDGRPNIMTAAWAGICCSNPPMVYVSVQKPRATYANIMERKAFTVSKPSESHAAEADYAGIASGRNADKFQAAKLTPVKADTVDAPYVEEFPVVLECRPVHSIDLGTHTQFIGEILDVKADEAVLNAQGVPDVEKARSLVFGTSKYFGIGEFIGPSFSIGKKLQG